MNTTNNNLTYQNYYYGNQFQSNSQYNYNYSYFTNAYSCYGSLYNFQRDYQSFSDYSSVSELTNSLQDYSYNTSSNNSNSSFEQNNFNESNLNPVKKSEFKCQICNSDASGFHYGAYTCVACKLFYLRFLKNKNKYMTNSRCESKNCQITSNKRSNCSECRFKKCLEIGMSKNRSCFGRHILTQSKVKLPKRNEHILLSLLLTNVKTKIETLNENVNQDLVKHHDYINQLNNYIRQFCTEANKIIFKLNNLNDLKCNDNQFTILFILFIVLFDIKIPQINLLLHYDQLIIKLKQLISLFECNVLNKQQFSLQLKTLTFVLLANILFEQDTVEFKSNEQVNDLIGFELKMIWLNSIDNQNQITNEGISSIKCQFLNSANQIHSILASYLNYKRF